MKPFSEKSLSRQTLLIPGAAAMLRSCDRTFFLLSDLIMVRRPRRKPSATRTGEGCAGTDLPSSQLSLSAGPHEGKQQLGRLGEPARES